MADFDEKSGQTDAIQRMLEKLRQNYTNSATAEPAAPADDEEDYELVEMEEGEPILLEEDVDDGEELTPAPEEVDEIEKVDEIEEERDGLEEDEAEDEVSDEDIAAFFTMPDDEEADEAAATPVEEIEEPEEVEEIEKIEEKMTEDPAEEIAEEAVPVEEFSYEASVEDEDEGDFASVSVDDFASALDWQGEQAPTAPVPPPTDRTVPLDISFLAQGATDAPEEQRAAQDIALAMQAAAPDELPEPPVSSFPTPFSQRARVPEKKATPAPYTGISDKDAEILFAARPPAAGEEELRRTYRMAVARDTDFATESEVEANEENGYAVEVEVVHAPELPPVEENGTNGAETEVQDNAPASFAPAAPVPAEVETVDDDGEEEYSGAFYTDDSEEALPPVPTPAPKKTTPTPAPRAAAQRGGGVSSVPTTGEQISMEFDVAPAREASDLARPRQADAPRPVTPARPATPEQKAVPAPSAPEKKPRPEKTKREKGPRWLEKKKEAARRREEHEALAGLYEEEAATYLEYTSRKKIGVLAGKFLSEISIHAVRIILLSFLCAFFFLLESPAIFGVLFGGIYAQPQMLIALHLLGVLFLGVACLPTFSFAWRQLFARRVSPSLYLLILVLLALANDIVLYVTAPTVPDFFGLIPAAFSLFVAVADHRKTSGDLAAFRLVTSAGDKLACTVSIGGRTRAEADAVADLPEGEKTRIASVKKVGTTTGFFHRISRSCENARLALIMLLVALAFSLASATVTGVVSQSVPDALYTLCFSLSLSLPLFALYVHKLPTAALSHRAVAQRAAVVGEVSAIEYSDVGAMAFEDVEAFPPANVRVGRVKLYADTALDRVLYQVAGLFSAVGGPLDTVFRSATADFGLPDDVALLRADEGGLVAAVNGREITVGRGDYMLDRKIHIYYDPDDEQMLVGGKTSVLYAAENGNLIAKFYIRYKMDPKFEKDVERLHRDGVRTLLRTYDPNLRDALMEKISYTHGLGLRVVHKTLEQQQDFATPQLNSGLVSRASVRDVLSTLLSCRHAVRLSSAAAIAAAVLGGIGMVGSLVLSALSLISAVPVWAVALYPAALFAILSLLAKTTL